MVCCLTRRSGSDSPLASHRPGLVEEEGAQWRTNLCPYPRTSSPYSEEQAWLALGRRRAPPAVRLAGWLPAATVQRALGSTMDDTSCMGGEVGHWRPIRGVVRVLAWGIPAAIISYSLASRWISSPHVVRFSPAVAAATPVQWTDPHSAREWIGSLKARVGASGRHELAVVMIVPPLRGAMGSDPCGGGGGIGPLKTVLARVAQDDAVRVMFAAGTFDHPAMLEAIAREQAIGDGNGAIRSVVGAYVRACERALADFSYDARGISSVELEILAACGAQYRFSEQEGSSAASAVMAVSPRASAARIDLLPPTVHASTGLLQIGRVRMEAQVQRDERDAEGRCVAIECSLHMPAGAVIPLPLFARACGDSLMLIAVAWPTGVDLKPARLTYADIGSYGSKPASPGDAQIWIGAHSIPFGRETEWGELEPLRESITEYETRLRAAGLIRLRSLSAG